MNDFNAHIKKLTKTHADTADYYQHCAHITTEADLKDLFYELATHRLMMCNSLLATLSTNAEKKSIWRLKEVLSYLQRNWLNMKIALIANNRTKILQYCRKAEWDALRGYENIQCGPETSDLLFRYVVAHQQNLKEVIQKIEQTSTKKFYATQRCAA